MSKEPLTDFIASFVAKQQDRERADKMRRDGQRATIVQGFCSTLTEALGQEALAALEPEWGVQKTPSNYAQVVLHYKGAAFTLKDAPGFRLAAVQSRVAKFVLDVDKEQEELATERAKLFEALKARPLPGNITVARWNEIQHVFGDDAGLLAAWEEAMAILDKRVQVIKAEKERERQVYLKASREFMLETIADIERSDDERHIKRLGNDVPQTVAHEDLQAIRDAAFERLQELDREYERQEAAKQARVLELERAEFLPFHFYEVHYQTGVFYEEGHPGVETGMLRCYSSVCTEAGWWFSAKGGRVRLPFVSKVVERVVCAPDDFWPRGMWEMSETDDGVKYRVPSRYAARADDACAQAKEVQNVQR